MKDEIAGARKAFAAFQKRTLKFQEVTDPTIHS